MTKAAAGVGAGGMGRGAIDCVEHNKKAPEKGAFFSLS